MRPLLRGCQTCGPGAPDALHGALHGLVPRHGQLEDDGRGARGGGAGAAQAPARARPPGRLFHRRRCPCSEVLSGLAMHWSASNRSYRDPLGGVTALHRLSPGYKRIEHKGQGTAGPDGMHARQTSLSCRRVCTE